MPDIFSRSGSDFRGSFASDAAKVVFSGSQQDGLSAGVGLLTQNMAVNYTQQVTRLYEIGTNFTYLIAGRTQGQLSMGRILGPRPVQIGFYTKYGSVCNAATNNLNFEATTGCQGGENPSVTGEGASIRFGVKNAVITNIALTVAAMDMIINEQLAMMFISLDLKSQ